MTILLEDLYKELDSALPKDCVDRDMVKNEIVSSMLASAPSIGWEFSLLSPQEWEFSLLLSEQEPEHKVKK